MVLSTFLIDINLLCSSFNIVPYNPYGQQSVYLDFQDLVIGSIPSITNESHFGYVECHFSRQQTFRGCVSYTGPPKKVKDGCGSDVSRKRGYRETIRRVLYCPDNVLSVGSDST